MGIVHCASYPWSNWHRCLSHLRTMHRGSSTQQVDRVMVDSDVESYPGPSARIKVVLLALARSRGGLTVRKS